MSPNNGDVDGTIYWSKLAVSLRDKCLLQQHSGAAQPGRLLGVLGPSGAGKSTLLAALAGTLQTRLKIEGNVWSSPPPHFHRISWTARGRRVVADLALGPLSFLLPHWASDGASSPWSLLAIGGC
ncbi:unnamed protein product [Polarella glacialis]|uniref:ABC transporter domain-containing protein n=1 Tax=Polarella glacialis TaxID=89957 RepID=A0A813D6X1_POLGL|nr:unnamed protein product [Polarella glacialis]